jgi:hypothetical protein
MVNPGYYHSAGLSDAYATASGGLACRDYSGQRIPCDKLFRDAANGYYSVLFVRTTGGMGGVGGETSRVMAGLGLMATSVNGQRASRTQWVVESVDRNATAMGAMEMRMGSIRLASVQSHSALSLLAGGQERQRNAIQWQRWVIERFDELYSKVTANPQAIFPLKGEGERVQCAQLPQRWNERAGGISYPARNNGWMRGPQVMGSSYIAPGTVVATFLGQDYYPNRSGGNHVGIFVSGTPEGFYILEQYQSSRGGVIGYRFISASPVRAGNYSDYFSNANQYSVVIIPTQAPPGCNCGDSCKINSGEQNEKQYKDIFSNMHTYGWMQIRRLLFDRAGKDNP